MEALNQQLLGAGHKDWQDNGCAKTGLEKRDGRWVLLAPQQGGAASRLAQTTDAVEAGTTAAESLGGLIGGDPDVDA